MKYSSFLIYGCNFPENLIKIIETNSSLSYFNKKIKNQYNCEIIKIPVLVDNTTLIEKYYLVVNMNRDDNSIIKTIPDNKFKEALKLFEMEIIEPYYISVPIKIE